MYYVIVRLIIRKGFKFLLVNEFLCVCLFSGSLSSQCDNWIITEKVLKYAVSVCVWLFCNLLLCLNSTAAEARVAWPHRLISVVGVNHRSRNLDPVNHRFNLANVHLNPDQVVERRTLRNYSTVCTFISLYICALCKCNKCKNIFKAYLTIIHGSANTERLFGPNISLNILLNINNSTD